MNMVKERDRKRNDDIRHIIALRTRYVRPGWDRTCAQWREDNDCAKQILEADVCGERSRETGEDGIVKCDLEKLQLVVDTEDGTEWRRTHVADPSP